MSTTLSKCIDKMKSVGVNEACITSFTSQYNQVLNGNTGNIPESTIESVDSLPTLADLQGKNTQSNELLGKTVVLKLNGGLGTGMGLSKAKSFIEVKDGNTFLDFIAKQIIHINKTATKPIRFMLMNSFSTSTDTKDFINKKYQQTFGDKFEEIELLQNKVPKINLETMEPAVYDQDKEMEWCPPGHGDLYAAILGSGKLQKLIDEGYEYMFVSNSDNLGACVDLSLLHYVADNKIDFLMEVCQRTEADKKGGHLARSKKDGRLLLRESAQSLGEDQNEFQNIEKHKYFNTNNLWMNLKALKEEMNRNGGMIPLPVIRNEKTVNPTDESSMKVIQFETAMGAAINCFKNAAAVLVPRTRFAPVKTCSELLGLRSDAFVLTDDFRLVLNEKRNGKPPLISLENKHYKYLDDFEKLFGSKMCIPSLVDCTRLTVKGPIEFEENVKIIGDVTITNSDENKRLHVKKDSKLENLSSSL
eukprot:Tbor_TRINITY_DN5429_c3_g5::TRINITY_DN5429_c3_g5_i1::g.24685::m.24685/K00963/UGP2, galU, galF; UTP--glucose-1-phosphate uridylyltransferase